MLLPILGAAVALCCGPGTKQEQILVAKYTEGIQSQHRGTYESIFLACRPAGSGQDLFARLSEYEKQRRTGSVEFSADGVELIKLSALGRGAFYKVLEVQPSGETLRFQTIIKPEYFSINFEEFLPGTVIYVLGEPLGKVLLLKIGKIQGPVRRVLKSVEASWTWRRRATSPVGWCLESVLPLPGSAVFQELRVKETEGPAPPEGPAGS